MKTNLISTTAGANSTPVTDPKKDERSKGNPWIRFKKVPHLFQHEPTGTFYARVKLNGKSIRASLDTDTFTTAKVRLPDKLAELRAPKAKLGTFAEARLKYEQDLDNDTDLAEASRYYRKSRIAALLKSWPGLDQLQLAEFELRPVKYPHRNDDPAYKMCRDWWKQYKAKWDWQNANNTLGSLRLILTRGGLSDSEKANAAFCLEKAKKLKTELKLPTQEQFTKILETIETSGAGQARHCADLVRFLAFSGCRISEARRMTWSDVDMDRNFITVHNAKVSKKHESNETRNVPMIAALRELLERLRQEQNPQPTDRVCILGECEKSLTRACKLVGCSRLTHHSLRHYFGTICIENGVSIPRVAKWLGHRDKGQLLLEVYNNERDELDGEMAAKVNAGITKPENVLTLPAKEATA